MRRLMLFISFAIFLARGVSDCVSAEQASKRTVPAGSKLQEALQAVREEFQEDYAKAKRPEQKEQLAKRLLLYARVAATPTEAYALLRVVRDMSIQAKGESAFTAIDEIAKRFDVDRINMTVKVLAVYGDKAATPKQHAFVAKKAIALARDPAIVQRKEAAKLLQRLAGNAAKGAGDKKLSAQAAALAQDAEAMAAEMAELEAALITLEKNPADREANLVVGKFLCFRKGDWAKGLMLLVQGNDTVLKELAEKDLSQSSTDDMLALADAWWLAAKGKSGDAQRPYTARALHWYERVAPALTGDSRAKVESRLRKHGITPPGGTITAKTETVKELWPDFEARMAADKRRRPPGGVVFGRLALQLSGNLHLHSRENIDEATGTWRRIADTTNDPDLRYTALYLTALKGSQFGKVLLAKEVLSVMAREFQVEPLAMRARIYAQFFRGLEFSPTLEERKTLLKEVEVLLDENIAASKRVGSEEPQDASRRLSSALFTAGRAGFSAKNESVRKKIKEIEELRDRAHEKMSLDTPPPFTAPWRDHDRPEEAYRRRQTKDTGRTGKKGADR